MKKRKGARETPDNNSSRTNIKNFTNINPNKHKTPEKAKQHDDSITKVNFSRPEDLACYANQRSVHSFRCDDGLWNELVPVLKDKYGSVCRAIEVFGTAILHQTTEKVNICNTVNALSINQTVSREMRPRRKLEFSDDPDDLSCHYCSKSAVGEFRYKKTGEVFRLCEFHARMNLDSKNWEVVDDE